MTKPSQNKNNRRRGATLAEVLFAAAVLGILGGSLITALTQYNSQKKRILTLGSKDIQISGLVENIRSNLQYFQSSYEVYNRSASVNLADRLMPTRNDLPLVWSANGAISSPAECPSCEGRLGLVIQPLSNSFNAPLFMITLRVSHPELNSNTPTDYRFISAFKD